MKKALSMAIVASVVISAQAWSQTDNSATYPSISAIPAPLRQLVLSGAQYPEQYIDRAVSIIRNNGRDKTALDMEDIQTKKDQLLDQERRRQVEKLISYDKNFDGRVTRDEIIATLSANKFSHPSDDELNRRVSEIMAADANGDAAVDVKEMADYATKHFQSETHNFNAVSPEAILALDPNGDGKITVTELTELAQKAWRTIDANKDGTLSPEELAPLRALDQQQREVAQITPKCTMPSATSSETVIFIGESEGKAVSSVSVAGQAEETDVIPLVVGNTSRNLYIIAAATTPVIWQMTGAVDRISNLVLIGPSILVPGSVRLEGRNPSDAVNQAIEAAKVNAGETGVPSGRVAFLHAQSCGFKPFYDPQHQDFIKLALTKMIGRGPDLFLTEKSATALHLLDDHITHDVADAIESAQQQAPDGYDANAWRIHTKLMPGGLANLRKDDVVSDAPVEDYKALPRWAGVAKLIHEGILEPVPGHRSMSFVGDIQMPVSGTGTQRFVNGMPPGLEALENNYAYRIVGPLEYFPPGNRGHGAMLPEYILPKGMTMPKGEVGPISLICEETGKTAVRGSCDLSAAAPPISTNTMGMPNPLPRLHMPTDN